MSCQSGRKNPASESIWNTTLCKTKGACGYAFQWLKINCKLQLNGIPKYGAHHKNPDF